MAALIVGSLSFGLNISNQVESSDMTDGETWELCLADILRALNIERDKRWTRPLW